MNNFIIMKSSRKAAITTRIFGVRKIEDLFVKNKDTCVHTVALSFRRKIPGVYMYTNNLRRS